MIAQGMENKNILIRKRYVFLLFLLLFLAYIPYFYLTTYQKYGREDRALPGYSSVAEVKKVDGKLRRQPENSIRFRAIPKTTEIHEGDLLVTGPQDEANLELFDHTEMILYPGTLVKFGVDRQKQFGGINRVLILQILSGAIGPPSVYQNPNLKIINSIKTAKDIVPLPAPQVVVETIPVPVEVEGEQKTAGITIQLPKNGTRFRIVEGGRPPFVLAYRIQGAEEGSLSENAYLQAQHESGEELSEAQLQWEKRVAQGKLNLRLPGLYRLKVVEKKEGASQVLTEVYAIRLFPEIYGLKVGKPLINGMNIDSNQYRSLPNREEFLARSDIKITLKWQNVGDAIGYRVIFQNLQGDTFRTEKTKTTDLTVIRNAVLKKPFEYKVQAVLPHGFFFETENASSVFQFNSPKLTLPLDGASSVSNEKGILFTWQRTLFTAEYQFELGADTQFKQMLKQVKLKDNFVVFKNLRPGTYFWRVRSLVEVDGQVNTSPAGDFRKILVTTPPPSAKP